MKVNESRGKIIIISSPKIILQEVPNNYWYINKATRGIIKIEHKNSFCLIFLRHNEKLIKEMKWQETKRII